jgi:2-polyprenyl-3-methyl-5-hydroxy-6-metoxy-1,4-benzoquinol methylase
MRRSNDDEVQYDKWWTDFVSTNIEDPGTAYRADFILKIIKNLGVKNIADVGCGSGQLIKKISKNIQGLNLTGFDVSQKIIDINKNNYKDAEFFCLNLNDDVIIDRKFDMVICCEVIEHLRNWEKSIETLSKLALPGGYVLITTQSGKIHKHHEALGHLKHFNKKEIEEQLKKNGMKIIESSYAGWPFMNLKNILAHIFIKNIKKNMLSSQEQGVLNRFIFKIFGFLYKISSKKFGPQIFVLSKK